MLYEVLNITMHAIISLALDPYFILIVQSPKFFLVTLVQQKCSYGIIQCFIWYSIFVDWGQMQLRLFFHLDERNFIILVHQFIY